MNFSCFVDIDLPRKKVIELFDDPENMQYWQDGFIAFEHKSGIPGTVGSQSIVKYEMRGKPFELLETVTVSNFPDEFHGTYSGDFGENSMKNYFEVLGPNQTRWRAEIAYYKMNHFMMRIIAFIKPSMFKKQTQKWLDQFKVFAEQQ